MPRPRKRRFVQGPPFVDRFDPNRISPLGGEDVVLTLEGLEAIRLSDLEGLDQEACARRMEVSRPTFGRLLAEARTIVAQALVLGKVLRIEGGHFQMPPHGKGRCRRGGTSDV